MNEETREPNANFDKLQQDLSKLIEEIAAFAHDNMPEHQAHQDCGHDHSHDHHHHDHHAEHDSDHKHDH